MNNLRGTFETAQIIIISVIATFILLKVTYTLYGSFKRCQQFRKARHYTQERYAMMERGDFTLRKKHKRPMPINWNKIFNDVVSSGKSLFISGSILYGVIKVHSHSNEESCQSIRELVDKICNAGLEGIAKSL